MLKSYKYRIYPNDYEKNHLTHSLGCVRYIYNQTLAFQINNYKTNKTPLKNSELNSFLMEEKNKNIWLKEACAQSLQASIKNLENAYISFFKKKTNFPKFKKKKSEQTAQYPQGIKVNFEKNKIYIPKLKWINCVFDKVFTRKN